MSEQKKTYDISDLLSVFDIVASNIGGADIIDYIAITPNEFSIYIMNGISMILMSDISALRGVVNIDSVFFNENNPQLVISNTKMKEFTPQNDNIISFMNFVNDCAQFICPCTGSEIHLSEYEIKIFIDQTSLLHNEYIGIANLFKQEDVAIKIVFDIQRPYISIMDWRDIKDV